MKSLLARYFWSEIWRCEETPIRRHWTEYSRGPVLDEKVVESGILPLVRTLNKPELGIETIASCQGHYFSRRQYPYIYFHSPLPIAIVMAKALHQYSIIAGKTNFHWHLGPAFNGDFKVCFSLNLGAFELARTAPWNCQRYWREPIQQDILSLSKLFNEVLDQSDDLIENINLGTRKKWDI